MSEEQPKAPQAPQAPQSEAPATDAKAARERMMRQDWFLEGLVAFVDQTQSSLSMTLSVGGTLVSGQLVGGKEYFEGMASMLGQGDVSASGSAQTKVQYLRKLFADTGTAFYGDKVERELLSKPLYLHLKNARFFGGPSELNIQTGWWRGRISAIDGFFLGELT
jgi:hypothetical protein